MSQTHRKVGTESHGSLRIEIAGLPGREIRFFVVDNRKFRIDNLRRKAMRKFWLVITVMLLAVALGASGALSAQLSLSGDHAITTSLVGPGGPVNPTGGYMASDAYGYAYYNPTESPGGAYDFRYITFGTPDASSSAIPAMTWLQTTSSAQGYNGAHNFTMQQNYVGNAPSPSSPNAFDGYLQQSNSYYYGNYFHLDYVIPADGSYTANVSDLYNMVFQLVNAAGGSNYFYQTQGYSYLQVYFNAPTGNGSGQKQVLADYRYDYPNAVPDFTVSRLARTASVTVGLDDLVAGDNVSFDGYVYAYQYGSSNNVPLPPSALLLGSGLLGLGLLRRKWSLKK
jgi:hypothetical protein